MAGANGGLEFDELPLLLLDADPPEPFTLDFLTCNARWGTCSGVDEDICKEFEVAESSIGTLESVGITSEIVGIGNAS